MSQVNEILDIEIKDTTIDIELDGSGIGSSVSVEELNRYAYNNALNAFRLSQLMNSLFFQMEDGVLDFFTDQLSIDLENSGNQVYTNFFGTAFYYTPIQIGYVPQDMNLRSISFDSNGVSGGARLIILEEDVDTIILNTDLKAFVSRDNGNTFTQVLLTKEGNQSNNFHVLVGDVDLSSQPEDLHLVWKIDSYSKNLRIYSVGLNWL